MSAATSERTFRLIYRSRDLIPSEQRKAELGSLFTGARSNNKKLQITGALLVSGQWFAQTLEGDEQLVRTLFARIETDPRHDSVSVLQTGDVEGRVFPRWSMAQVAEDSAEPDTYLIAHQDGISPATSRGTSPAQDEVLDFMRDSVRGADVR